MEQVERSLGEGPVDEDAHLKEEWDLHEDVEACAVGDAVLVHHELRLHQLRQALPDLESRKIKVKAVQQVEYSDVGVRAEVIALAGDLAVVCCFVSQPCR